MAGNKGQRGRSRDGEYGNLVLGAGKMQAYSLTKWQTMYDSDGIITRYRDYLKSIRSRLPRDIQRLAGAGGDVSLNDGTITHLDASVENSSVNIFMDGKWIEGTTVGLRKYQLTYSGVTHILSTIDPDARGRQKKGYGGYGDHGADEFELISDDLYEHRMLFWSGIILNIRFSGFTLAYEDVPNKKYHG